MDKNINISISPSLFLILLAAVVGAIMIASDYIEKLDSECKCSEVRAE